MTTESKPSDAVALNTTIEEGVRLPTQEEFARPYFALGRLIDDKLVAATLTTFLSGFIAAVSFYERAGIVGATLPTMTLAAAGIAFGVITIVSAYLGVAIRHSIFPDAKGAKGAAATKGAAAKSAAAKPTSTSTAFGNSLLLVLIYLFLLFTMMGHLGGFVSYTLLVLLLGFFGVSPLRLPFYYQLLFIIVFAYFFGRLIYPAMPRAIGGGRPVPVRVAFADKALERPEIKQLCKEQSTGSSLYQTHADEERVYFALDDNQPPASDAASLWLVQTLDPPFSGSPNVRFFSIPKADVLTIRHGATQPGVEDVCSSL